MTTIGSSGNFASSILVAWLAMKTGSLAIVRYYSAALLAIGAGGLLFRAEALDPTGRRQTKGPHRGARAAR